MSWLSDLFGGGDSGPDPNALRLLAINQEVERRRREAEAIAQENERARLAGIDTSNRDALTSAMSTNVGGPTGPASSDVFANAFPSGFESTSIPSSLTDPYEASAATAERGKAQSLIDAMVKRGTLTSTGATKATDVLGAQDASVRSRLNDIGNVLLENERAKLRGIGTEASTAAGSSPTGFDPTPYTQRVSAETDAFKAGLPAAFSGAVPSGGLYDVSGLAGAGGAVAGSQVAPQVDPYAQEGGQLKTGLETPTPSDKKRSAAVF
jgi:hypothetical protein